MTAILSSEKKNGGMYVYALLPFHIIRPSAGNCFGPLAEEYMQVDGNGVYADPLRQQIRVLDFAGSRNEDSHFIGDPTKYYDFIEKHFGISDSASYLEVYPIDPYKLIPSGALAGLKNLGAQFSENAGQYRLGGSNLTLSKFDSVQVILNPSAGLGYLLFGLLIDCAVGSDLYRELHECEFFRNIGWKRRMDLKRGSAQHKKYAFSMPKSDGISSDYTFTVYELIDHYFHPLRSHVRFYQDRMTLLYCSSSFELADRNESELTNMFYDILRVPDRNAPRFSHELTEPILQKPGRNIVYTALNEGAFVIETVNTNNDPKTIAKKYVAAFLLAINQREVLLKTMHRVSLLRTDRLMELEDSSVLQMTNLKTNLLVIQLKQIFYSISNTHEVEKFFNHLQQVFNIDVILKENDQSIREMYNLLELKQNKEILQYQQESAQRDSDRIAMEEYRARIVNTILSAIACLGLFSFLKDLWPFTMDPQYALMYKIISIVLPVALMAWLAWYMFGKHHKY